MGAEEKQAEQERKDREANFRRVAKGIVKELRKHFGRSWVEMGDTERERAVEAKVLMIILGLPDYITMKGAKEHAQGILEAAAAIHPTQA